MEEMEGMGEKGGGRERGRKREREGGGGGKEAREGGRGKMKGSYKDKID